MPVNTCAGYCWLQLLAGMESSTATNTSLNLTGGSDHIKQVFWLFHIGSQVLLIIYVRQGWNTIIVICRQREELLTLCILEFLFWFLFLVFSLIFLPSSFLSEKLREAMVSIMPSSFTETSLQWIVFFFGDSFPLRFIGLLRDKASSSAKF